MKCSNCGFDSDKLNVNPLNNFMNEYVDDKGKVNCVLNNDAEHVEVKGVKLTRKDKFVIPVASTPSTPSKEIPKK